MVSHDKPNLEPPWTAGQFVGGHPALDLVNTVSDRVDSAQAVDRLQSVDDLTGWLLSVGLVTPDWAGRMSRVGGSGDPEWLGPVRALREAAWTLLNPVALGQPPAPAALAPVLAAAGTAAGALTPLTERTSTGATSSSPALPAFDLPVDRPDALVALLALQVLEAFFVLPRERLRCCPRCGWLFHDSSRGGRRRWCKMVTCGNREKATRHYRRRQQD